MKKNRLLLTLALLLSSNLFAENVHYAVIVDAGSSGSRLHVFRYHEDTVMPQIETVFSEKNTTPLSTFAQQPENAIEAIKPLLDNAAKKIKDTATPDAVPISILGTAGMRFLPANEQKQLYDSLKQAIQSRYKNAFVPNELHTITGKMEGIYGWLAINYLAKNFQDHHQPFGVIDIGGGSVEIAFATDKSIRPIDEMKLTINHTDYLILSKSFLGLGLEETTKTMLIDQDAAHCFPKNYKTTEIQGDFNLVNCSTIYRQIIANYEIDNLGLPLYKTPKFIAYSGAYDVYHFFGTYPNLPDQETSEQTIINPTCSNHWNTLKEAYPYEPENYLASYCSNGIFLTTLLYEGFKLQSPQLSILAKINEQRIDWTLGAMLYTLIK